MHLLPRRSRRGLYSKALAWALSALVLLYAVTAEAVELRLPSTSATLRVGVTQSLIGDYHLDIDNLTGNPGDNFFGLKNRSTLVVMHGTTSFTLRIDGNWYVGADTIVDGSGTPLPGPNGDPLARPSSTTSVEKVTLSSIQRAFDVTAGDFYIRIGRGIAIDITKLDELTQDTTVRGGRIELRVGVVRVLAFGGWINPLEVDNDTDLRRRVPADLVGGGRLEVAPHRNVRLGAHYVGYGMQNVDGGRDASHVLGLTFEFPNLADVLTLYTEFNYLNAVEGLSLGSGTAVYFSGTLNLGRWAFLLEFRHYNDFQIKNDFQRQGETSARDVYIYSRAPTLTRPKQEIINNSRVLGPRLRVDLRIGRAIFFLSGGMFWRATPSAEDSFFDSAVRVVDVYGGIQSPILGGNMEIQGGYRFDTLKETGQTDYSQLYLEGEISVPIRGSHNVEVQGEYRKLQKVGSEYWDMLFGVSYRPNRFWAVGLSYSYSNEFSKIDLPEGVAAREHFVSGQGTVNFTPTSYARIFVGTTRGGLRCLDGFCRTVPPFVGARTEVVFQF